MVLHKTYVAIATEAILDLVTRLEFHREGVVCQRDVEDLHQLRVLSRRLRNALWIFKDLFDKKTRHVWDKQIASLSKVSSHARDLDVFIYFLAEFQQREPGALLEGVERLLKEVKYHRQKTQESLNQSIDQLNQDETFTHIKQALDQLNAQPVENKIYQVGYKRIKKRIKKVLAFEPYVANARNVHELHQMRIAVKLLRYTLECLSPQYQPEIDLFLKRILVFHRSLGSFHDYDVWGGMIQRVVDEHPDEKHPGLNELKRLCEEKKNESFQKFTVRWSEAKADDMLGGLKACVKSKLSAQGMS